VHPYKCFFPAKQVLTETFYKSDFARNELPQYQIRMHLGEHQMTLAFFDEEVLARYFDHPELYEIKDTSAGGELSEKSAASQDRHLHIRYGKRNLKSGRIAVTAIHMDLANMGVSKQRFWHAHECKSPDFDDTDENFNAFVSRTFAGAFVEFPNPIGDLFKEVQRIKTALAPKVFFARIANVHLRIPVERTYKSYCDSASELYKVVGPDALSKDTLEYLLKNKFGLGKGDFIHKESCRPLGSLQLLTLLESKLQGTSKSTMSLRIVSEFRVAADHKILESDSETQNYSTKFAQLCDQVTASIAALRIALLASENT
jgi:hypothetical protein